MSRCVWILAVVSVLIAVFAVRDVIDHSQHARQINYADPIDILLLGDSITQDWGGLDTSTMNTEWKKRFGIYKSINAGLTKVKVEDLALRLDHRDFAGLKPRVVILMIGINNLLGQNTNPENLAKAIQQCVVKVRWAFPKADVILVKILPACEPLSILYRDVRTTNGAIDRLRLDNDPQVRVLDLTKDFLEPDGALKKSLFFDQVHLSQKGYGVYAEGLRPLIQKSLAGR